MFNPALALFSNTDFTSLYCSSILVRQFKMLSLSASFLTFSFTNETASLKSDKTGSTVLFFLYNVVSLSLSSFLYRTMIDKTWSIASLKAIYASSSIKPSLFVFSLSPMLPLRSNRTEPKMILLLILPPTRWTLFKSIPNQSLSLSP